MKKNISPAVGLGVVAVALIVLVGVFLWRDSRRTQEVDDLVRQSSVGGGMSARTAAPAMPGVPAR